MKREYAWLLRLGAICLIVAAVFSIANGRTLLGIAEFLGAAAGILAVRGFFCPSKKDRSSIGGSQE